MALQNELKWEIVFLSSLCRMMQLVIRPFYVPLSVNYTVIRKVPTGIWNANWQMFVTSRRDHETSETCRTYAIKYYNALNQFSSCIIRINGPIFANKRISQTSKCGASICCGVVGVEFMQMCTWSFGGQIHHSNKFGVALSLFPSWVCWFPFHIISISYMLKNSIFFTLFVNIHAHTSARVHSFKRQVLF